MAGITQSVTFAELGAVDPLQGLLDRIDNSTGFLKNVGEQLKKTTGERARAEVDPEGVPWQRLMPATIKARIRDGWSPDGILRRSGALIGHLALETGPDYVEIGSVLPYAAIHQLGGEIKKDARTAKIYRKKATDGKPAPRFVRKDEADDMTDVVIGAHTIKIPARRYLGVSTEDREAIIYTADVWLRGD